MSSKKPFHVQCISDEFSRRYQSNPHYSLRSFARDLAVTPSWLSDFLSRKKGISIPTAERIARSLGFGSAEKKYFLVSVQAHHSRNAKDREAAKAELQKLNKSSRYKMKPNDFVLIGSWYHQAILELTELDEFSHTEVEVAQRLRLPPATIKRAIADLQSANLLTIEDGKMRAAFEEHETSVDLPSSAIRKYHEQILQQAQSALREQSVHDREYNSIVFAFDHHRVAEAKEVLREFHKSFTDRFYIKSATKNSVYQLSLQFFKIDYQKEIRP